MSKALTLDDILDSIEVSDRGVYECSGGHDLDGLKEAKQAILQWVADEVVGKDTPSAAEVGLDAKLKGNWDDNAFIENNVKLSMRQTLKAHGWKGGDKK